MIMHPQTEFMAIVLTTTNHLALQPISWVLHPIVLLAARATLNGRPLISAVAILWIKTGASPLLLVCVLPCLPPS